MRGDTIYDDLNELVDIARGNVLASDKDVKVLAASLRHFIGWALDSAGVDDE